MNRGAPCNPVLTWWGAREAQLNQDTDNVHIAKAASIDSQGARRTKDEHGCRHNERSHEVEDAIRDPSQNIENCVLVDRDDVANVRTVDDVLEGRKDSDPDLRAPLGGNKSAQT